jgi:hypothetical protein
MTLGERFTRSAVACEYSYLPVSRLPHDEAFATPRRGWMPDRDRCGALRPQRASFGFSYRRSQDEAATRFGDIIVRECWRKAPLLEDLMRSAKKKLCS